MIGPRLFRIGGRRRGQCRPRRILALALAGLVCLGLAKLGRTAPGLVWNNTASAPIGLYRLMPSSPIHRGDRVLARLPDPMRRLAAERGYLPETVPLVKTVGGVSGDLICAEGDTILVNGQPVAIRLRQDRWDRSLPTWTGCRHLDADMVFLLTGDVATSFDGRYFGPIPRSNVLGLLVPLWTE
ncbi:conjugative transfer signal peptidase TraF [Magnetospirillum molischianum]|uniref:Plasmid transfer protein TraF n=1 Tax=Magnetospirillum molischianum DSM 120 TaxID=1150626 RepID=H8FVA6_MAGML|nr:conjugative transfer signal peptidase TraF [Magnetospirillum molischianum]CCG42294.1 Plasmid transfer protein TraF [Magnetospirillum molischianum DSM 120]